jgi:hypothetical protein
MSGAPMPLAEEMAALQARMAVLAAQKAQIDQNAKAAAAWDAQPANSKKAVSWELPPAVPAYRNSGVVLLPRPAEQKGGAGKGKGGTGKGKDKVARVGGGGTNPGGDVGVRLPTGHGPASSSGAAGAAAADVGKTRVLDDYTQPLPKRAPLPLGKSVNDLSSSSDDDQEQARKGAALGLQAYSSITLIDSDDEVATVGGSGSSLPTGHGPLSSSGAAGAEETEGVDFAGASGSAANVYVPLRECSFCDRQYSHFGGMAYLRELPGYPFEDA